MKRLLFRAVWAALILSFVFALHLANDRLQNSYQDMLVQAGIAVIMAVSLNIVNGFTGQFSIGHAGFMAVGAYAGGSASYLVWQHAHKTISRAHPGWGSDQVMAAFWSGHWHLLVFGMLVGGVLAAL